MLKAAGHKCQRCGGPGKLEVHHKVSILVGGDPFDRGNLEVLCRRCHERTHKAKTPGREDWFTLLEDSYGDIR